MPEVPAGRFQGLSLERLGMILAPYWPEAKELGQRVQRFPAQRDLARGVMIRKCIALGLDPTDCFHPHPERENLGSEGIPVGQVLPDVGAFHFGLDELRLGVLLVGQPGSGKTTAGWRIVRLANEQGVGVLAPDLRGDWAERAAEVADALVVPMSELRFNPFWPPPGVDLRTWAHFVAARLTLDLGLQLASQAYVIRLLSELVERFAQAGACLSLLDFYDLLKRQKPRPRSSEEGYWERVIARVQALVEVSGEACFDVQEGFRLIEAVEAGRLVVIHLMTEKFVADFLASVLLYRLYFGRLFSARRFAHRTALVVLDEQRNLIRRQDHEAGVPDFELLASRSRALGLGFVVCEQVPSAVSPAVLTSTRLRLAFNSTPPESLVIARLLGLNAEQANELATLPVGQCIARLGGERIPHPFRLEIPAPGEEVSG